MQSWKEGSADGQNLSAGGVPLLFLCMFPSSSEYQTCSTEQAFQICESKKDSFQFYFDPTSELIYKVDKTYEYYLENWYLEMDLLCMPVVKIGLLITAYYIGFAVGGLMYNWPEKYGRKNSVLIGMAISIVA